MKSYHIVIYSLVFAFLSLFSVNLVTYSLTGKQVVDASLFESLASEEEVVIEELGRCSSKAKIENLDKANDSHLRKLEQYQNVCDSFVASRVMIFTDMPKDEIVARESAVEMAIKLDEFSKLNVTPLIVVEPVTQWGLIDFKEFRGGFYDDWIDAYFEELKLQGVTDDKMGIWVPFPEANLPNWNHSNATPEDFSAIVNKYLSSLKKYFPQAKASILLNSATYENDDFNWTSGEYVNLVQYVEGIDKGLVDSFGIQGFPWAPRATDSGPGIFDAREYLNSRLAIEAAETLEVSEIWFNTGSFSSKYTLDGDDTIYISAEKRKAVLDGILQEVLRAKEKGYVVWINVFAEDKSFLAEATNWSYWEGDAAGTGGKAVFVNFVSRLEDNEITLSLFDIQK